MFFTQWARCHCADSHSSRVTCAQPGNRVQSGSASSARRYAYGWLTKTDHLPVLIRVY